MASETVQVASSLATAFSIVQPLDSMHMWWLVNS